MKKPTAIWYLIDLEARSLVCVYSGGERPSAQAGRDAEAHADETGHTVVLAPGKVYFQAGD